MFLFGKYIANVHIIAIINPCVTLYKVYIFYIKLKDIRRIYESVYSEAF